MPEDSDGSPPGKWKVRAALAAVGILLVFGPLSGCAGTSSAARSQPYLLVLGDSLSTGYQPAGGGDRLCSHAAIDKTGHGGWACLLLAKLRSLDKSYAIKNLAVNGEDTCAFISGKDCTGQAFGGSVPQLRQARDFLRSHHGATGLITLDIGADDATALEASARSGNNAQVLEQLPVVFARAALNYRRILKRLRQIAPKATIMALGYYVPNLPAFISPDLLPVAQAAIRALAQGFNTAVMAAAKEFKAIYVNLYGPFNGRQATVLVPGDIHPNDAGQRLIARLIWRAYSAR